MWIHPMENAMLAPNKSMEEYLINFAIMGWVGGKFQILQQHGHMQGRQASIQLIWIVRCPDNLLGLLEAPLWLDTCEPEVLINYLGVTRYV